MRVPGFVGGAYELRSKILAGERCINLFPETVDRGGKAASALLPAPGLPDFATMVDSPGRGLFSHKGRLWGVFGRTLSEIDSVGTKTDRGTLAIDGNPVTFDTNGDGGNELMVSSGDAGYILDLTTHVLSTPLASGVTQVGQLDGFFVSLNAATSTFRISEPLDGLTWDASQIAQRSSASDPWVAMIVARSEIYLFGEKTGEAWFNRGSTPFPFAARPEGFFQVGIAAPFSLARFAGSIAWLGKGEHGGPQVYLLDGYTPTPISTPGITWQIQHYIDTVGVDDAVGWSYSREDHEFYVLTFPRAGATWVYDRATRQWHERGYWDIPSAAFTMYRPMFHAECFGKNLVCDSDGFKVYNLSSTVYTDVGGSPLRRLRRTPHLSEENKRLFFHWVELECDRGVGNENDPGQDPVVVLDYSDNGGQTFKGGRARALGKLGEYDTRVRWEMCGSARDRVWDVWATDPVVTRWFDLYAGVTVGKH